MTSGRDSGVSKPTPRPLPAPNFIGGMSVEEAIAKRRSVRKYAPDPITMAELSQLLWSAQGVTDARSRRRASPSAGALYPLELYVVVRERGVVGLPAGVYHYSPEDEKISLVNDGDRSSELRAVALDQEVVGLAAVNIVTTAVVQRTRSKYGERALQYIYQESGHAAENVFLQAVSLGLGAVVVGAFNEEEVRSVIGARPEEMPVYIQTVGVPLRRRTGSKLRQKALSRQPDLRR
ncbi:MAG: SagB/ThcOx family dehydrogenase [Nitrososphaerales archaeon]